MKALFNFFLLLTGAIAVHPPTVAQTPSLYDRVSNVLAERYYDPAFRSEQLPALIKKWRPQDSSDDEVQQREAIRGLLSEIPASHLALLSHYGRDFLINDLAGRDYPTLGFQLMHSGDGYYATALLEHGPAAQAGLRNGDRILAIDGVPTAESVRLDWSTDDPYLDDKRDPPMHALSVSADDRVALTVVRTQQADRPIRIEVGARPYSAWAASRASVRAITRGDGCIGYVHLWYVFLSGVPEFMTETLAGPLKDCDALVLDLRGRGGNATVVPKILQLFEGPQALWPRPVVALFDRQSRSGKDVLAYEFKRRKIATLVGEATAGAVIPASFADLGEAVLMFPSTTLPGYTERLELKPTSPDFEVARAGPYSAGADPIFERGLQVAADLAKDRPKLALNLPIVQERAMKPLPEGTIGWPQLRQRMIDALGGEAALRRQSGWRAQGNFELVDTPYRGTVTVQAQAPQTLKTVVTLPGIGTMTMEIVDGKAVATDPGQPEQEIASKYLAANILPALFYGPLDYERAYERIKVVGATRLDDVPVWELRLATANSSATLFVSIETGLPLGVRSMQPSPIGEFETTTLWRDYRNFGGRLFAMEQITRTSAQTQRVILDSVSLDFGRPTD